MLTFFIEGTPQPAPKIQVGRTKSGRQYTYKRDKDGSKEAWAEAVRLGAIAAMNQQRFKKIPRGVAVGVHYDFYFKWPKLVKKDYHVVKPDQSNLIAAIDNALKGVVFHDDNQINEHIVNKAYAVTGKPGVEITVYER